MNKRRNVRKDRRRGEAGKQEVIEGRSTARRGEGGREDGWTRGVREGAEAAKSQQVELM